MERTGKNVSSFPRVSPPGPPYHGVRDSLSRAHPALLRRAALGQSQLARAIFTYQ